MIYYIEDDGINASYWCEQLDNEGIEYRWFDNLYKAWCAAGNPEAIVWDVGCIGLLKATQDYLNEYWQFRDRFPGTPIFLVSGLPALPRMIMQEIESPELTIPICGVDFIDAVVDYLETP